MKQLYYVTVPSDPQATFEKYRDHKATKSFKESADKSESDVFIEHGTSMRLCQ